MYENLINSWTETTSSKIIVFPSEVVLSESPSGSISEYIGGSSRGNYSAGEDSMKALEDTMELFTEFAHKMIQEVDSPEAKQIIKKHLKKISQMSAM